MTTSEYAERTYPELASTTYSAPWEWSRFDWSQDSARWANHRCLIPYVNRRPPVGVKRPPVSQDARDRVRRLEASHREYMQRTGATETREQHDIGLASGAFHELEDVLLNHHHTRHQRIDNPEVLKSIEIAYLMLGGVFPWHMEHDS